jgi:CheY-like chemotaxis protein
MGIALTQAQPPLHTEQHLIMTANKPVKDVTKILIVEDEGDMSLLLELLLDGDNMELEHAHNLTDARNFVEKEQPNLIVLDNRLPDGYGIDQALYASAIACIDRQGTGLIALLTVSYTL